jgi:uncharacterized protein (TIGR03382 family)
MLLLLTTALAGDTDIYYNSDYMSSTDVSALSTALTGQGATVTTYGVDSTVSWPTSYTGKELIIILLPPASFSTSEASALESFVNGGGRLALSGDWESKTGQNQSGFYEYNDNVNDLLTDMNVSMSIKEKTTVAGSGCGSTTSIGTDSITTSVTSMYAAAANPVDGGTTLVSYSSKAIVAVDQPSTSTTTRPTYDVVLSGDVNIFLSSCTGSTTTGSNVTFWENLYNACDDDDGDGYTDSTCGGDDCDDTDSSINPGASETCNGVDDDCDSSIDEGVTTTYYIDSDGDGYGGTTSTDECSQPTGYVATNDDCDDADSAVNPGATEVCNSIDDDCDGDIDESLTTTYYVDSDGDGYGTSSSTDACTQPSGYATTDDDCDDSDSAVNPGATEVCNSIDDDCDGDTDEGLTTTFYVDSDGDGYGGSSTVDECTQPTGYVTTSTDCDDTASAVNPGATEVCNSIDDDCDGDIDDDDSSVTGQTTWYADGDSDAYGDSSTSTSSCSQPSGYVSDNTDCDDTESAVNPGESEICDSLDNDCDGTVDNNATDASTWYADNDGDTYGDATSSTVECDQPSGYVSDDTDCDDTDSGVNPGATEVAYDGIDNDCDGDDLCDVDLDGYDSTSCSGGTDCDDTDAAINPGATEVPYDGVDDDCSGDDECDVDGDGYDSTQCSGGTDCDDTDSGVNPGGSEICNGADDDCDGTVDETTGCYDDDGDGFTENSGDCDDGDAAVSPAGVETCDGVDEDCDGTVDEDTECYDDDGDGWTEDDGDCNDGDEFVSPDAVEIDDNGIDDDCDSQVDDGISDPDGDGYTEDAGDCDPENADVWPGAPELEDGIDNDCDGEIDQGTAAYDDDGDGFSENEGDCWDDEILVSPEAEEILDNGIDDDCDGEVDEGSNSYDDDGDGLTEDGGDCDDDDPDVRPGAEETADGIDSDCDDEVDEGTDVYDDDGDGWSEVDGDCNDKDGWVNPGALESCDGLDNNCDGSIDEDCAEELLTPDKNCGCTGAPPAAGWLFLPLLLALRRRRAA